MKIQILQVNKTISGHDYFGDEIYSFIATGISEWQEIDDKQYDLIANGIKAINKKNYNKQLFLLTPATIQINEILDAFYKEQKAEKQRQKKQEEAIKKAHAALEQKKLDRKRQKLQKLANKLKVKILP